MTATAAHLPPHIVRRRRATVGAAVAVVAVLIGGAAGAPITARLFDVAIALGALAAGWALVRELRTPSPAPVPARFTTVARATTVAGVAGRGALADAA